MVEQVSALAQERAPEPALDWAPGQESVERTLSVVEHREDPVGVVGPPPHAAALTQLRTTPASSLTIAPPRPRSGSIEKWHHTSPLQP